MSIMDESFYSASFRFSNFFVVNDLMCVLKSNDFFMQILGKKVLLLCSNELSQLSLMALLMKITFNEFIVSR